tara:strand:+ start:60 stop:749 length:690 start_codon:yes stop_codon:yes gene_type:complete
LISVIIPTLNEEGRIGALLNALARETVPYEVVLVDGGSEDKTTNEAAAAGAVVLSASGGRGAQLVAGVNAAKGDIILFLHADSRFPEGGLTRISKSMADDERLCGGNFRLLFDGDDPFSRWLDGFYVWLRSPGFYYGDSGIFVRRDVYDTMGGIRPIALMEDYDFVRRLEAHGKTCCIEEPPLRTSSRRFEGRRPAAIVFGWFLIHGLFHLGVSPERLARIYNSTRRRR